jgi:hypothetical protein
MATISTSISESAACLVGGHNWEAGADELGQPAPPSPSWRNVYAARDEGHWRIVRRRIVHGRLLTSTRDVRWDRVFVSLPSHGDDVVVDATQPRDGGTVQRTTSKGGAAASLLCLERATRDGI